MARMAGMPFRPWSQRVRPPILALLPVPLVILLAACAPGQDSAPAGGGGEMPPPEVVVHEVRATTLARSVEIPGRMEAVRSAEVRARVEGILEQRLYTEGSEVKAGTPLFRIDPRTLAASLAAAKANLAKAEAQAQIAEQTLARNRALFESKMVSQQLIDQSLAVKAEKEAEVGGARATLTAAEIDLAHATVIAPIAGRVGRALVTEGALVGKNEATHLATIEQYDPIRVAFSQSSTEFMPLRDTLRAGAARLRLILDDGQEYPHPGRVLFNDLAVDPATGTVGVRAEFPNPERRLLPGQYVRVRLPLSRADAVFLVPQRSVQVGPQGQTVLSVGADGTVAPLAVKTGGLHGDAWIILSGLKGGERIIVDGVQKARPGMKVKAVAAGAAK